MRALVLFLSLMSADIAWGKRDTLSINAGHLLSLPSIITHESMLFASRQLIGMSAVVGDVVLLINSGGGEVTAGKMFMKAMDTVRRRGNKIECVVLMAMSMAYNITEKCTKVFLMKDAQIMWHEPRFIMSGTYTITHLRSLVLTATPDIQLVERARIRWGFPKTWFYRSYSSELIHKASTFIGYDSKFVTVVDDYAIVEQ